jgi:hypothetical protein
MNATIITGAGGCAFHVWLKRIGVSRNTGLKWKAKGYVVTHNVDGVQMISDSAIAKFWHYVDLGTFEFGEEEKGVIKLQREKAA